MTDTHDATHPAPVWMDQADAVVVAAVQDRDAGFDTERLPARQLDDGRFAVCCIPFFVDLALGDVVRTDDARRVTGVSSRSGRVVLRVRFGAPAGRARADVARDLQYLGAMLEWSSPQLLAVDVHDAVRARAVESYLAGRELRGDLVYARVRTG